MASRGKFGKNGETRQKAKMLYQATSFRVLKDVGIPLMAYYRHARRPRRGGRCVYVGDRAIFGKDLSTIVLGTESRESAEIDPYLYGAIPYIHEGLLLDLFAGRGVPLPASVAEELTPPFRRGWGPSSRCRRPARGRWRRMERKKMTEHDWQTSSNPMTMLAHLPRKENRRKLRLYACVAVRQTFPELPEPFRGYLEMAERYADGMIGEEEFRSLEPTDPEDDAGKQAVCRAVGRDAKAAALAIASYAVEAAGERAGQPFRAALEQGQLTPDMLMFVQHHPLHQTLRSAVSGACKQQADLLREIFGNPFRPMTVDPAWLAANDAQVRKLAQAIYDACAFEQMPALADALARAGCSDVSLLEHCRSAAAHVRGCWLLDALLGNTAEATVAAGREAGGLAEAVLHGDAEAVSTLLRDGADPNGADEGEVTFLARAADAGRLDVVRALVEGGARVDDESANGTGDSDLGETVTPLLLAGYREHHAVYDYLERRSGKKHRAEVAKALVKIRKKRNRKLLRDPRVQGLFKAVAAGDVPAVAELVAAGVELNAGNDLGWGHTALQTAVFDGQTAIIQLLLDGGADPNGVGYEGTPPLHVASHRAIAEALLRAGADPNRAHERVTPLARAVARNLPEVAAALLQGGAAPDAPSEPLGSALASACAAGHLEVVRLLLEAGASVDRYPKKGWPPLMHAASAGHEAVVRALLAAGADIRFADRAGATPLTVAADHPHIVKLLKQA